MTITSDRNHPGINKPGPNGQNEAYIVLSDEERAKGFVEPVRHSYVHAGPLGPRYALRDLTPEEQSLWDGEGFVKYEEYPKGAHGSALGRFWTQGELDKAGKGCGTETRMNSAIAETYARNPGFYGYTFCCGCGEHLPVAEFTWAGTAQRVGSRSC